MPRHRRPAAGLAGLWALAFAAVGLAQEPPDPLAGIQKGMRVEIRTTTNEVFRGEVKWVSGDRVKIDITYENKSLAGTLTFQRSQLRAVLALQSLSDREKERILREREETRARDLEEAEALRRDAEARKEAAAEEEPPAAGDAGAAKGGKMETRADREKRHREELLQKFPPSAGWSDARYAELMNRDLRDLDADEKEFRASYSEWAQAKKEGEREERRRLLEAYPVEKGWGPEKYDALRLQDTRFKKHGAPREPSVDPVTGRKRAGQNDTVPPLSADERRFVDRFDDWKVALSEATQDAEDRLAEQEAKKREASGPPGGAEQREPSPSKR